MGERAAIWQQLAWMASSKRVAQLWSANGGGLGLEDTRVLLGLVQPTQAQVKPRGLVGRAAFSPKSITVAFCTA
jgi:hypothetical protein